MINMDLTKELNTLRERQMTMLAQEMLETKIENAELKQRLEQLNKECRTQRLSLVFRPSVVDMIKQVCDIRHQSMNDYIETTMERIASEYLKSIRKG